MAIVASALVFYVGSRQNGTVEVNDNVEVLATCTGHLMKGDYETIGVLLVTRR